MTLQRPASRRGILATLLLPALLCAACASVPTTGTYRSTTGTLAYTQIGSAQPTIVLQAGLGDGKAAWGDLISRLSPRHTVFAYDRPGYGDSSDTSAPRDPCAIAVEMHGLLDAAGIKPPYVLVGHSIGGLYQYAYARLYPDEVAGLVLLDATHPKHWQHVQTEAPAAAKLVGGMRSTVFSSIMRREFDAQAECADRLARLPAPRVPTKVLTRTDYDLYERGAYEQLVHADEQDWLLLTGAARVEPVAGSGHYIQKDQPAAAAAAIEAVAAQAGAR